MSPGCSSFSFQKTFFFFGFVTFFLLDLWLGKAASFENTFSFLFSIFCQFCAPYFLTITWFSFLKYFFRWAPFGYLYFLVCNSSHRLHPSSSQCRGSIPQPLDCELSALTTRPWLSPYFTFFFYFGNFKFEFWCTRFWYH